MKHYAIIFTVRRNKHEKNVNSHIVGRVERYETGIDAESSERAIEILTNLNAKEARFEDFAIETITEHDAILDCAETAIYTQYLGEVNA